MKKIIQLLLVFVTTSLSAQTHVKEGIALQGYDPVAYFIDGKAINGTDSIRATYGTATYCFASDAHKEIFLKNPAQYEPQFGGFCAYGMSKGYKAPVDPKAFTIVHDKLYLNYSLEVRDEWQKEREIRIQRAEQHWEKLKSNDKM